ncbi:NAD(P)-dependent dehydrogenase, short-chain alcohol dehydrogenase family (modular protein) [Frankia canadensis]|uniref:NAD(P)-dependent dehydrogenase, short-chain alcohol dehydrogenase family (Modular protein) n=1 Tax=Frankia canadensis TaxID=1836972 RepID=A0A2I2KYV3_9ACTN|nr:SDR family oxidoreductase [Frankia canadensis]SNQ50852.1 NAD(P)-dependent dehydrogenase, short-chain alcohol dehydrogenase family (modular protein) [Frankia canadensis]SOU58142.1 NAD(P)-dependent dehydrogenase, short-chain alcohol dehydrogenase family (modular protein) [Frankia canadensis]
MPVLLAQPGVTAFRTVSIVFSATWPTFWMRGCLACWTAIVRSTPVAHSACSRAAGRRVAALAGRVAGVEQLDGADRDAVAAFLERFGPFEHLVLAFSPGAAGLGPIREISLDDVETAFTAKLFAYIHYIHAIREAKVTESITMISAASARAALPGTVTLAAVNGAIERIVSPLAAELAPVRVNAVAPGVVDTAWWSFLPEDQRRAQFDAAASSVPAGRIASAADVADAIEYLIGARLVTGSILPVDGGFTVA